MSCVPEQHLSDHAFLRALRDPLLGHKSLVRSEVIKQVKAAFDQHGITIPFPIRTLDFGIKGGTALAEIWRPDVQSGGSRAGAPIDPTTRGS